MTVMSLNYPGLNALKLITPTGPGGPLKRPIKEIRTMKTEYLKELGLSKDQINKVMAENGKDIKAEQAKTDDKLASLEAERDKLKEQVDTATAEFNKLKSSKNKEMKNKIKELESAMKAKDEEYAAKESERAFNDLVKDAIKQADGRNEKAIMALLDTDTLKESQNQKDDIAAAIETVKGENGYMFGASEPINNATVKGEVGEVGDAKTATLRAAMGLPPND